jgi:threonine dehydrogenase-like Zn-dependent dehydrogenase
MPGGAAELVALPVANLHVVPDGVEARDAVLVEPGVTALNAIERLGDVEGRRTLIVGAGTVGLIAAQLLLGRGALVDILVGEDAGRDREDLADRIGASVERHPQDCGYVGVIEAAGTAPAFKAALASVSAGGRVALVGVQGGLVDNVNIDQIVLKDATVSGVLNGPGLYDRLLGEMAAGALDASVLIDSTFGLLDAEAAMARLRNEKRPAPKVMLEIIKE